MDSIKGDSDKSSLKNASMTISTNTRISEIIEQPENNMKIKQENV